jgi:hypothetical protein
MSDKTEQIKTLLTKRKQGEQQYIDGMNMVDKVESELLVEYERMKQNDDRYQKVKKMKEEIYKTHDAIDNVCNDESAKLPFTYYRLLLHRDAKYLYTYDYIEGVFTDIELVRKVCLDIIQMDYDLFVQHVTLEKLQKLPHNHVSIVDDTNAMLTEVKKWKDDATDGIDKDILKFCEEFKCLTDRDDDRLMSQLSRLFSKKNIIIAIPQTKEADKEQNEQQNEQQ